MVSIDLQSKLLVAARHDFGQGVVDHSDRRESRIDRQIPGSRTVEGRPLTAYELERVTKRYPGS